MSAKWQSKAMYENKIKNQFYCQMFDMANGVISDSITKTEMNDKDS